MYKVHIAWNNDKMLRKSEDFEVKVLRIDENAVFMQNYDDSCILIPFKNIFKIKYDYVIDKEKENEEN